MAETKKTKEWYKRWWMILVYCFVGLMIIGAIFPDTETNQNQGNLALTDNSNSQNQDKSDVSPKTSSSSKSVSVGEEGRLYLDSETSEILVAIDKEALDDLTDASVARDTYGYQQVYYEGRAYWVASGTKVLVLDRTFATTKFRIVEGDYYGEIGWVPYEWVIK
ncbi:MAG: hypothetical protein ABIJ05_05465 [Patescibacteria group bacterium]